MNRIELSNEQLSANRTAIHGYIANATKTYGRGSVILLPEFEENEEGQWVPSQGTGARVVSDKSAFLRFGKMTINQNTGKPQYLYTNHFGDSEGELTNMLAFVDPNATIGTAVRGIRLVIQESVVPFSKKDPTRDIKWADQAAGIKCMKAVVDPSTGEVTGMTPIYRRTKVFFADDEGNYPPAAVNTLVEHDNKEEISTAASAKWNAANSEAIARAARIAALQAKGTSLTAIEKKELKELTAA